jgi:sugar phosphate isomerase/epimerase
LTYPLLSLASGVLPEFTPQQTAAAAVAAGWKATGIWVEPSTWTRTVAQEVRAIVQDAGIPVLDVEVIWLKPGADNPDHFRVIDAGADIGASHVLMVSSDLDPGATAGKLGRLSDHASERGLRVCLEFAAFTAIRSLAAALDVLARAGRPEAGLLIDPLHFRRTGGAPADLLRIDPSRLPYAQFCDAPADGPSPDDVAGIIEEAVDLRLPIGEGGLPLAALLDALPPSTPLSVELRSKALREGYPDPADRARALLASTRAGLDRLERQSHKEAAL